MITQKENKRIDIVIAVIFFIFSKTSIVVAADESVVSWGPSPTSGELVRSFKSF
jgi:hypothetical protein